MSRLIAFAALVAVTVVGSASATESTIVRGVGIGKVRAGMTRAQVEKIFGANELLNDRDTVGGTSYVEYGWNFSTWSVGFLRRGPSFRVAQVATTLRGQKTREGIGVGSLFKAVARAYPQAICTGYYVNMGSRVPTGPPWRTSSYALVVAKERKQLAFLVTTADRGTLIPTKPWYVYAVVVRNSVPRAVDFPPQSRCKAGWKERGRPYESILPGG